MTTEINLAQDMETSSHSLDLTDCADYLNLSVPAVLYLVEVGKLEPISLTTMCFDQKIVDAYQKTLSQLDTSLEDSLHAAVAASMVYAEIDVDAELGSHQLPPLMGCPLCGTDPLVNCDEKNQLYYVECPQCGLVLGLPHGYSSRVPLAADWNRRTP